MDRDPSQLLHFKADVTMVNTLHPTQEAWRLQSQGHQIQTNEIYRLHRRDEEDDDNPQALIEWQQNPRQLTRDQLRVKQHPPD